MMSQWRAGALSGLLAVMLSITGIQSVNAAGRDEVLFFFNDALGSAVASVNEAGKLCWEEHYTPYGDKTLEEDSLPDKPNCGILGEERGFTGHTEDYATDLVYMQQRYYDPILGRFLSIDPSHADPTAPVTLNRYAYANNNPYKYTDPDGEFAFLIPVAIFIAKEIAAKLASEATGGLTDFLSFRRLAATAFKKGAKFAKKASKSGKNKSGENCSFDAKTLVKVSDGYMPIIDIEPGVHEVWSKSEVTGEIKLQPVMDTFVADYDTSVTLTVFNTKDNIVSRIKSNEIHPYYVLKSTPQLGAAMPTVQSESSVTSPIEAATTGEWVEAGRISVGDLLMDIDGRWQEVTTVSIDEESLRAYNIDVANFDTYFVTDSASAAADLWVHNQGCGDAAKKARDITTPYKRPSGATTKAQRESVQDKPCVDCGVTTPKQYADHKDPLVKEYYRTGTIDKTRMRDVDSVQSQCPTYSNKQGAEMSRFSRQQKKDLGL